MIESILTEWRFRLESGYPKTDADYEVLRDVLTEMTDLPAAQQDYIINRAKGQHDTLEYNTPIVEEVAIDSIENQSLINIAEQAGKLNSLIQFLKLLPTEANTIVLKFLNSLNVNQCTEFINLLYSHTQITEDLLNTLNLYSGFPGQIFNLAPIGMGKGEILLSVLFSDAQSQGAGKSYDLVVNTQKYEVKDYTQKSNASIRLGTKSVVTQFDFWDEIITTLSRLSKLRGTLENPKFDFRKYFNANLLNTIDYLDKRRGDILSGKLNLTDKKYLQQFYINAAKINNNIDGYTNVILRGPNAIPIELSIKPIEAPGDTFMVTTVRDGSHDITYINAELRRLKYVRNPSLFDVDLQAAVDYIVGNDLQFIVFRKNRINVTSDFMYHSIDTGRIRIIEKSISRSATQTNPEPSED